MSHEDYENGVRDGVFQERERVLGLMEALALYSSPSLLTFIEKLLIPSIKGETNE